MIHVRSQKVDRAAIRREQFEMDAAICFVGLGKPDRKFTRDDVVREFPDLNPHKVWQRIALMRTGTGKTVRMLQETRDRSIVYQLLISGPVTIIRRNRRELCR